MQLRTKFADIQDVGSTKILIDNFGDASLTYDELSLMALCDRVVITELEIGGFRYITSAMCFRISGSNILVKCSAFLSDRAMKDRFLSLSSKSIGMLDCRPCFLSVKSRSRLGRAVIALPGATVSEGAATIRVFKHEANRSQQSRGDEIQGTNPGERVQDRLQGGGEADDSARESI